MGGVVVRAAGRDSRSDRTVRNAASQLQASEAQRCNVLRDCADEVPLARRVTFAMLMRLTLRLRTRTKLREPR